MAFALLLAGIALVSAGVVLLVVGVKPWQPPRSYVDEWYARKG